MICLWLQSEPHVFSYWRLLIGMSAFNARAYGVSIPERWSLRCFDAICWRGDEMMLKPSRARVGHHPIPV